jgi:hypothetical protein
MARTWIEVTKDVRDLISPTRFHEENFHGKKANSANKVPDTHSIDARLPKIAQIIQDYVDDEIGAGNTLVVTSTKRTPAYNLEISHTGASGVHVKGIAMDFAFIGPQPKEAWKVIACAIRNQDTLLTTLLDAGAGGFGLYGKGAKWFIHIDTRGDGDGESRAQTFGSYRYALWTKGEMPECEDPIEDDEEEVANDATKRHQEGIEDSGVKVIKYTLPKNSGHQTFSDLVLDATFIAYDMTSDDLKDFEYKGKSNNKRAYEALTIEEKRSNNGDDDSYASGVAYPLSEGVVIIIEVSKINIRDKYESNLTSTKVNVNEYFPQILRELTVDPGFVPAYKNRGVTAKDIRPQVRVFLWSRAKYLERSEDSIGFIDITKDIGLCSISNHIKTGGDFSIDLSGVGYELAKDEVDNKSASVEKLIVTSGDDDVLMSNVNKEIAFSEQGDVASEFKRNIPYYQRIIGKNDLVFISYEKLKIDGAIDDDIDGKWYDMIGLVDHVAVSSTGSTNEISVAVRGKSLMSVLEDDNAYFNPFSIGHASSIYGDQPFKNGRYMGGQFQEISAITARSIKDSLEFIFSRIATIGYVPDDVFNAFEDKTTITYRSKWGEEGRETIKSEVKGIWQIMSAFIDSSITDLRVVDDSISNPDGSIFDLILKVCQDPFVEFFTDTYGDRFWMIARKPPFTQEAVFEAYKELPSDVDEDFQPFIGEQSSNSGGAEGETLNRYREKLREKEQKRAQESGESNSEKPTVFGGGAVNELDEVTVTSSKYPKIININEDDVISDTLRMSSKGYAWYQVEQRGNFAGANQTLGHVPALYFDGLAQVIGNRRLSAVSNYSNYKFFSDKNTEDNIDLFAEQASQELAFLVETNIHLPFTREGTITMNGDRRIKVGNYIYFRPTDEVFYVTQVSQDISIGMETIDRTTTVQVERGMKAKYIGGRITDIIGEDGNSTQVDVSYFNIVDIPKLTKGVYDIVGQGSADDKFDYKADITVNQDVLNFFLQNKQFDA